MSDVDLYFRREERVDVAAVENPPLLNEELFFSGVVVTLSRGHLRSFAYFLVLLYLRRWSTS